MQGYLVQLGSDAVLTSDDRIVGPTITFTAASTIGTGSWTWSGTWNNTTYTNTTEPGTYYLGTDGNVYFVSNFGNVDTLASGTASTPATFDDREYGTTANDAGILGGAEADVMYGGTSTSQTGTANDTLRAGAGNDTVFGGDGTDFIVGSGGSDLLYGGTGNDTIYGDNAVATAPTGEALRWINQGVNGTNLVNGFTQDTGNMRVSVAFNNDGGLTAVQTANTAQYVGAGEPQSTTSALYIQGSGGRAVTTSIVFNAEDGTAMTDEVSNVSFRLNDVDISMPQWTDRVIIRAYDVNGNEVPVVMTATGDDIVSGNTVTGAGSGTDTAASANGSVRVQIAGPVHSINISYLNTATSGNQFLWITDVHYTTIVEADGADTIDGGSGNDFLYGGGGADVLVGGTGTDSMFGGDGNDRFTFSDGDNAQGGAGDDTFTYANLGEPTNGVITINGGAGSEGVGDTLNIAGSYVLGSMTKTNDGTGSFTGSVTMLDGTRLNFSEIENIICFTPGTHIATPHGLRDVIDLRVGDLVLTRDHGLRPIRWIQSRSVPGTGKFAPVLIRPGAIAGLEREIRVSPQHRMMFQGYRAELLFGEREVLIPACHLLDGKGVTRAETDTVTYVHMMFDEHEIIYAEGAATETFHPGDMALSAISEAAREELFAIFPELRSDHGGMTQTARRCLKRHESRLLAA